MLDPATGSTGATRSHHFDGGPSCTCVVRDIDFENIRVGRVTRRIRIPTPVRDPRIIEARGVKDRREQCRHAAVDIVRTYRTAAGLLACDPAKGAGRRVIVLGLGLCPDRVHALPNARRRSVSRDTASPTVVGAAFEIVKEELCLDTELEAQKRIRGIRWEGGRSRTRVVCRDVVLDHRRRALSGDRSFERIAGHVGHRDVREGSTVDPIEEPRVHHRRIRRRQDRGGDRVRACVGLGVR